jgi:hypothetical protein
VTGAELLGLQRPLEIRIRKRGPDEVTAMAVDHVDRGRSQSPRRLEHMGEQGLARERLQNLRQVRIHPLALAGGKDNDSDRHGSILESFRHCSGHHNAPGDERLITASRCRDAARIAFA